MVYEKKLSQLITSLVGSEVFDSITLNDESNLIYDLNFDSIKIIELVILIETEFGIELKDEDLVLEKMSTFGGLIKIIESTVKEKEN